MGPPSPTCPTSMSLLSPRSSSTTSSLPRHTLPSSALDPCPPSTATRSMSASAPVVSRSTVPTLSLPTPSSRTVWCMSSIASSCPLLCVSKRCWTSLRRLQFQTVTSKRHHLCILFWLQWLLSNYSYHPTPFTTTLCAGLHLCLGNQGTPLVS